MKQGDVPANNTVGSVLSRTTGIDLKTIAATNLYTVPTGKTAIVTDIVVRVTAQAGFSVAATAGAGVAAGEADIMAAIVLTGLNAVGKLYRFSCEGVYVEAVAAEIIKFGVDVGATATTLTAEVFLVGFLI